MKIRLKKGGLLGPKRTAFNAKIEKIKREVNPVIPDEEGATLFIRGPEGTGVIILNPGEMENLFKDFKKQEAVVEESESLKPVKDKAKRKSQKK